MCVHTEMCEQRRGGVQHGAVHVQVHAEILDLQKKIKSTRARARACTHTHTHTHTHTQHARHLDNTLFHGVINLRLEVDEPHGVKVDDAHLHSTRHCKNQCRNPLYFTCVRPAAT